MKVQTSMRLDQQDLTEAKSILAQLGMNFSEAVSIFTKMVVQERGLPFEVKLPNEETIKAMKDVRAGKGIADFDTEELK